MTEVFGLGSAADYLLESVYWLNRADFEEFDNVYINNISYVLGDIFEVPGGGAFLRRIIDYPTGLATAQVNINFQRTDESFYFNDGATEVIESGLYQKTDNGQGVTIYDRVPTESVRHRDQIGPPLVAPNKAGILDTDDLGRIWSAAGQVFRVLTPPNGDSEVMSLADLGPNYVPDPAGYADLQDRGGEGAWYITRFTHNLVQIQGPALSDLVLVLTWIDVWTWLIANVTGYNTSRLSFSTGMKRPSWAATTAKMTPCRSCSSSWAGIRSRTWQPTSTFTTSTILRRQAHPRFGASPHLFRGRCSGATTSTG